MFLSLLVPQAAPLAQECTLEPNNAYDILEQYADHHHDDLSQLVDEQRLENIIYHIRQETFYSPEHNRYYFKLAKVATRFLKGHVWLEVTCDEKVKFSYYIEEI